MFIRLPQALRHQVFRGQKPAQKPLHHLITTLSFGEEVFKQLGDKGMIYSYCCSSLDGMLTM